jgi:hypothetical protein
MVKGGDAWVTRTRREVGDVVRELALGLIALGRQQGDWVALLSASRGEWAQADFAIFSAGCITVPIYPTYPPALVAYLANDSQAKTLIGEDAAQLAKALQARPKDGGPRADHRAVAAEDLEVLGGGVALAPGVAYRTAGCPCFEPQAFLARLLIRSGPSVIEAGGHVVPEPGLVWEEEGEDNVSPDLAVLLRVPPPPRGEKLRTCPDIVVEVVSEGAVSRRREFVEKRELYSTSGAAP